MRYLPVIGLLLAAFQQGRVLLANFAVVAYQLAVFLLHLVVFGFHGGVVALQGGVVARSSGVFRSDRNAVAVPSTSIVSSGSNA